MKKYDNDYKDLADRSLLLRERLPETMSAFKALHAEVFKDNVLSTKTKELIALGIAVEIRCKDCIMSHVRGAKQAGCTKEEIAEAVGVAIAMGGGPSTAYGSLALDIAEDIFR